MDNSSRKSALAYDELLGPLFFEPYAIEVAGRLPESVSLVLEIAAGTGRVSRHLREQIPSSARLIASDVDEQMLAVAKEKLKGLDIEWQHIDAHQLPFGDNSIEVVICSFGYMFVTYKAKALAEAYRVLQPGGTLLFTTWDTLENNSLSHISKAVAEQYVAGEFPGSCFTATSMHDVSIIEQLLRNAGFSVMSVEKVEKNAVSFSAKNAALALVKTGPFFQEIKKLYPERRAEITHQLEKALSENLGHHQ